MVTFSRGIPAISRKLCSHVVIRNEYEFNLANYSRRPLFSFKKNSSRLALGFREREQARAWYSAIVRAIESVNVPPQQGIETSDALLLSEVRMRHISLDTVQTTTILCPCLIRYIHMDTDGLIAHRERRRPVRFR